MSFNILAVLFLALLTIAISARFLPQNARPKEGNGGKDKIPVSVNYHLTRQCNYSCGQLPLPLTDHY